MAAMASFILTKIHYFSQLSDMYLQPHFSLIEGPDQRPKGLCEDVLTLQFTLFTLLKNSQVNFIVQLYTFLSRIMKPILSLTMLIWYGSPFHLFSSFFFLLHHCADACCIGKIIILGYVIQNFIGSWLSIWVLAFTGRSFTHNNQ